MSNLFVALLLGKFDSDYYCQKVSDGLRVGDLLTLTGKFSVRKPRFWLPACSMGSGPVIRVVRTLVRTL